MFLCYILHHLLKSIVGLVEIYVVVNSLSCLVTLKWMSVQLQAGRPPGLKDVVYDEQGNVVSIAKIDLHKIPSRR